MEQEGTVQETAPQVKVTDAEVIKALSSEDKEQARQLLEAELKKIPKPAPLPLAMVLQNTNGPPPKTFVLARGDYNNPRDEVQPGFPAVSAAADARRLRCNSNPESESCDSRTSGALRSPTGSPRRTIRSPRASWSTASGSTTLDAGWCRRRVTSARAAQPPTHPDCSTGWPANSSRGGWSVKQMHKLILLSATYQQSERGRPPKRLAPRSGQQALLPPEPPPARRRSHSRQPAGHQRPVESADGRPERVRRRFPPISPGRRRTGPTSTNSADHQRRSIYIFARRNLRFPFLEVFDAPDSNLSCPERGRSTTAPQSLTLLNSDEVMARREGDGRAREKEATSTTKRESRWPIGSILGRRPTQELAARISANSR